VEATMIPTTTQTSTSARGTEPSPALDSRACNSLT
jgi:hypothetical protein